MDTHEGRARKSASVDFQEGSYRNTDELNLVDVWVLLVRRKKIVLGALLVTTIGASALAFLLPSVYESRAVVQIGQAGGVRVGQGSEAQSQQIELLEGLVERLKEEYQLNDAQKTDRKFPLINSVKPTKGTKNIVTITAQGYSAPEARDFLVNVTNKLLNEHDIIRKRFRTLIEERLEVVQNRLVETDKHTKTLSNQIMSINEKHPVAAGILTIEQGVLLQHITVLEKHHAQLTMDLNELDMKPTQFLREPTLPTTPIGPKLELYISLGVILGLLLGTLSVLFAERQSHRRKRTVFRNPIQPIE